MHLSRIRGSRFRILVAMLIVLCVLGAGIPRVHAAEQDQTFAALWTVGTIASAGITLAACPVAGIAPVSQQSEAMRGALTAASLVATPAYFSLKAAMAAGTAMLGYWMLLLSFDPDYAEATVKRGGRGDWYIRPDHVTCQQPIELLAPLPKAAPTHTGFDYPID